MQPGTKQGQPGTRQGQLVTKQGQPGTKQGPPGTKQGQGHNWTNAKSPHKSNSVRCDSISKLPGGMALIVGL